MELLYRRTPDDEGRDYGESEDILNKSGILLIARTQAGNIVGGYLGKELLMNKDTPD